MTRRVAVTGVGVVAPGGIGAPAFWDLLANGRTATRGITLFDPAGLPLPDRRRVRLRPGGARAGHRHRRAVGPLHPVRDGGGQGGPR